MLCYTVKSLSDLFAECAHIRAFTHNTHKAHTHTHTIRSACSSTSCGTQPKNCLPACQHTQLDSHTHHTRVITHNQVGVLVKKLRDAVDGLLMSAIAGGGTAGGGGGTADGGGGTGGGAGGGPKVIDTIRQLLAEAEDAAERS